MKNSTKKLFSIAYTVNYISQAAFSMICPAGLFSLLGWYLTEKKGCGSWVFAALIVFGVLCGFFCMIKYLMTMSYQLELMRRAQNEGVTGSTGSVGSTNSAKAAGNGEKTMKSDSGNGNDDVRNDVYRGANRDIRTGESCRISGESREDNKEHPK